MRKFEGVSPSQLETATCRLAWHLGYQHGYRAKRVSAPLDLGSGIHAGLEAWYGKQKNPVSTFVKWCQERKKSIDPKWLDDLNKMAEIEALGVAMLEGYLEHWAKEDEFLEIIAVEHTLTRKLPVPSTGKPSRFTLTVRLDGLVRDLRTDKLFSLEHKTFSRDSPKFHDLNHQFTAQVWLGQELADTLGLDEPVVGVLWNGLRKQAPGPKVKLPLFAREKIFRNDVQIGVMLHRAYTVCTELANENIEIYPNPSPIRCSSCDFNEVCIEWQRGGDFQFLLDEGFVSRDEREALEEQEEE